MKLTYLLLLTLLMGACNVQAQKIATCKYKAVKSVTTYDDGEVIVYRNKTGKLIADTIIY